MLRSTTLITSFLFVSCLTCNFLHAAEAAENEEKQPKQYYQIAPNILTFYQNTGKKIGYVVVQVQIVVRGQDDYDSVEMHLPLMQDTLIDYFNRQDKSVVKNLQKREAMRLEAKVRVAEVLKEEVGREIVDDLLFTQYIYQ